MLEYLQDSSASSSSSCFSFSVSLKRSHRLTSLSLFFLSLPLPSPLLFFNSLGGINGTGQVSPSISSSQPSLFFRLFFFRSQLRSSACF